MLRRLCRELVKTAGYAQCWISLKNGKGNAALSPLAQAGVPKKSRSTLEPALSALMGGNGITVVRDIPTRPDHSELRLLAQSWRFGAVALLPLIKGKRVLGALGLHAEEPWAFGDSELDPLRVLGRRLTDCFNEKNQ